MGIAGAKSGIECVVVSIHHGVRVGAAELGVRTSSQKQDARDKDAEERPKIKLLPVYRFHIIKKFVRCLLPLEAFQMESALDSCRSLANFPRQ
jgi:hypothetical protein